MSQTLRYEYNDVTLQVTVTAQNGDDEWGNYVDLMSAIQKLVSCASVWKHLEVHITCKEYESPNNECV